MTHLHNKSVCCRHVATLVYDKAFPCLLVPCILAEMGQNTTLTHTGCSSPRHLAFPRALRLGERAAALLATKACAPLLVGRGFSSLRLSLWHGAARLSPCACLAE